MKKSRLLGAVCACLSSLVQLSAHADAVSGQGTWGTTLEARDFDGDNTTIEGWYDTILNITWLTDANKAGTTMNWTGENTWAATLNINGITGWRLPSTLPVNGVDYIYGMNSNSDGSQDNGFNVSALGTIYEGSTGSEMAHLFYTTLGNQSAYELNGDVSSNTLALSDGDNLGAWRAASSNDRLELSMKIIQALNKNGSIPSAVEIMFGYSIFKCINEIAGDGVLDFMKISETAASCLRGY